MPNTPVIDPLRERALSVRLRPKGQITIPQPVRDHLEISVGDILTLCRANDLVILYRETRVPPQLAEKPIAR